MVAIIKVIEIPDAPKKERKSRKKAKKEVEVKKPYYATLRKGSEVCRTDAPGKWIVVRDSHGSEEALIMKPNGNPIRVPRACLTMKGTAKLRFKARSNGQHLSAQTRENNLQIASSR